MNVFKVNVTVYVEALDEEKAIAKAHIMCYKATSAVRSASHWVQDDVTTFVGGYNVAPFPGIIPSSYDKAVLTKVFGEDRAIRILNSY